MTRKPGSTRRLGVFDFNEDDERVHDTSKKLLEKFGNHKRKRHGFGSSPITKYSFLKCFAGHAETSNSEGGIDPIYIDDGPEDIVTEVGAGTSTPCKGKTDFKECKLIDVDDEPIDIEIGEGIKTLSEGNNDGLLDNRADGSDTHNILFLSPECIKNENVIVNEYSSPADTLVLSSSSSYENDCLERVEVDDDELVEMNLSTTSISTSAENEVSSEDQQLQYGFVGHKIDLVNMKVVVCPDFIMYADIYCTESRLTFSSSCIRIEGSTVSGASRTLVTEWVTDDIINIESEWCELVETAMISIRLKSKVSEGCGGANETLGVDKLKFSIYDPCWFEKEEAIKSLDARYNDTWNVVLNNDDEKEENAFLGRTGSITSKSYYNHDETLGEVIYPNGDPDAVLICNRDLELLQPQRFINDTIIDFYIKFLKNKIPPEDQDRFYFFNSFFFRKLAGIDKDLSSVNEGREAFERVRKWTRKVNLFEKDYIFIPVNYSLHWSLILICHPGEIINFKDDDAEKSQRVPCILHMDSIKGSHKGLKNLIQSYLFEEWKARHNETPDVISLKFLDLQFVSLELPQQENSFDCGLFLLHYVELFLEDAPTNCNPFKITQSSNFLQRNWFLPAEASLKRGHIKELIHQIIEDQIQKVKYVDSRDNHYSFDPHTNEHAVTAEHCFEEGCCSPNGCHGYSSNNTDTRIGFSFTTLSPTRNVQRLNMEPGSNSKDFSEPGNYGKSFSTGNYDQIGSRHRTNFLSPLLEMEQSCKQISDSLSETENCRGICGSVSPIPYFSTECLSLRSSFWKEGSTKLDETFKTDDNGTSSSGSQKSSEIGLDDDSSDSEFDGPSIPEQVGPPSVLIEDIAACIVEDSVDESCMNDADSSLFHSTCNNFSAVRKEPDTNEVGENDVQIANEEAATARVEQAKKPSVLASNENSDL